MNLYSNLITQWKFKGNLVGTKGNHDDSWIGSKKTYNNGVNGD